MLGAREITVIDRTMSAVIYHRTAVNTLFSNLSLSTYICDYLFNCVKYYLCVFLIFTVSPSCRHILSFNVFIYLSLCLLSFVWRLWWSTVVHAEVLLMACDGNSKQVWPDVSRQLWLLSRRTTSLPSADGNALPDIISLQPPQPSQPLPLKEDTWSFTSSLPTPLLSSLPPDTHTSWSVNN